MKRIFISTSLFEKCWRELGLNDDDLQRLQESLLEQPDYGELIQGTGGARKMRWELHKNKGKSGGIRIIYIDYAHYEKTYLLLAYPKSKKINISEEEKQYLKNQSVEILKLLKQGE